MGIRAYENGTLRFSRAERGHEGRYLCEANNGVGGGLSKVISLQVNESPWFALRSQRIQVEVDSLAKLSCQAKGDPPLNIIWTRDGAPLPPYPRYEVTERESLSGTSSDLLVKRSQVQDSGTFVCEASNPYGALTSDFHLVVQDVPRPPSGVKVVERGSRYLTIAWASAVDSNAPIINYIVTYAQQWTEGKESSLDITVEGDKDKVRIEGLSPATTYVITVSAQNRVGTSPVAAPIRESSLEEAPMGYPRNIRVSALSSSALQVTWDPPKENETNGLILGYYLGYKNGNVDTCDNPNDSGAYNFTTIGVEGLGVTSATLTSLRAYSKYSVVVQAFNSRGAGPSSPASCDMTMEDKPAASPSITSCDSLTSTSLKITWVPPPAHKANGKIISYRVNYRLENPKEQHDGSGMIISEKLSTLIKNLEPWRNYSLSVAASTKAGEGVISSPEICTTLEDVPASPERVKAVITGARSATASWSIPEPPNGRITGYTVYWKPTNDKNKPLSRHVEGPTRYLSLHNLKQGSNEIWITAMTSVGKGPPSRSVFVTPTNKVSAGIWSVGGNLTTGWNDDVQMGCKTVGKPKPKIVWSHLGKDISSKSERSTVLPEGTLKIVDVQRSDSGIYTCKASNVHGSDIVLYKLKILVPPTRPLLHVTETTSSSIRLQWSVDDDGGAPIRASDLYYRSKSDETKEIEILGSRSSHTVGELRCGTKHHFFVSTTNHIGTSDASKEVEARTKGRPPEAPPLFQFVTTNSSQATLYLTQWEAAGCPISHFHIQFKLQNSDNAWNTVGTKISPTRTFAVSGLSSGQKYLIRVKAFNTAGSTTNDYLVITPSSGDPGFRETLNSQDEESMIIYDREISIIGYPWSDPRILVPAVVSSLAILLTIATVCICLNKKPILGDNNRKKSIDGDLCAAHPGVKGGNGEGDLLDEYQIYSPVRRLPPTPNPPPPSENRDSAGDYSEDDVYQYATATYQMRGGSSPTPIPHSPKERDNGLHSKGFTSMVYEPPSLHDVDAPNIIPGGRVSIPPDRYLHGNVSETDDYESLAGGDGNRHRPQKPLRIKKNRYTGNAPIRNVSVTFREPPKSFSPRNVSSLSNAIRPKPRHVSAEDAECDMVW